MMNLKLKSVLVPLVFGLIGALPLAAGAAPFQNGSFESPGVVTGQYSIDGEADAPTGWLPGGALGNFALFYEESGLYDLTVNSGLSMVGFGGNGTAGASIEQTFDTDAGGSYTVVFYTSAQQLGNGPQSFNAEVSSGSAVLGSLADDIPDTAIGWVAHSFSFVATGASSTLRFTDTSSGVDASNDNWALDTVSVTSVPEPAESSLLAAGLLALGWRCRRQARR
jgi:hypothetical protein